MFGTDFYMLFPLLGLIMSVIWFVKVYRSHANDERDWTKM